MKTLVLTDEQALLVKRILQQASDSTHCLSLTEQLGLLPEDDSADWLAQDEIFDQLLDDVLLMF